MHLYSSKVIVGTILAQDETRFDRQTFRTSKGRCVTIFMPIGKHSNNKNEYVMDWKSRLPVQRKAFYLKLDYAYSRDEDFLIAKLKRVTEAF
jgi:hypothetical protein